jgi:hypothetical protein
MTLDRKAFGVHRALELLHPASNHERLTIVLKAYLDGSGKWKGGDPVIVVAGFIGSERVWLHFESLWKAFLDDFQINKRFHASPFWARERPYTEWSDDKHQKAQARLLRIFKECTLFGVGISVDCSSFNKWLATGSLPYYPPDPHYFCLDRCFQICIRGVSEIANDEGVLIYCDQEDDHEKIGLTLAKWHENRLRSGGDTMHLDPQRVVETAYGSSFLHTPLQAADIVANGIFRRQCKTALPEQEAFMDAMQREAHVTTIHFSSAEHIEIDMRKRAMPYPNATKPA